MSLQITDKDVLSDSYYQLKTLFNQLKVDELGKIVIEDF